MKRPSGMGSSARERCSSRAAPLHLLLTVCAVDASAQWRRGRAAHRVGRTAEELEGALHLDEHAAVLHAADQEGVQVGQQNVVEKEPEVLRLQAVHLLQALLELADGVGQLHQHSALDATMQVDVDEDTLYICAVWVARRTRQEVFGGRRCIRNARH